MKCKLLSHVQLLVTPWNSPWNSPGQNTGVGSLSLLQGIFPAQGSNPGLMHCRRTLYHQGSPVKKGTEWQIGENQGAGTPSPMRARSQSASLPGLPPSGVRPAFGKVGSERGGTASQHRACPPCSVLTGHSQAEEQAEEDALCGWDC